MQGLGLIERERPGECVGGWDAGHQSPTGEDPAAGTVEVGSGASFGGMGFHGDIGTGREIHDAIGPEDSAVIHGDFARGRRPATGVDVIAGAEIRLRRSKGSYGAIERTAGGAGRITDGQCVVGREIELDIGEAGIGGDGPGVDLSEVALGAVQRAAGGAGSGRAAAGGVTGIRGDGALDGVGADEVLAAGRPEEVDFSGVELLIHIESDTGRHRVDTDAANLRIDTRCTGAEQNQNE